MGIVLAEGGDGWLETGTMSDSAVSIHPYFKVNDGKMAEFRRRLAALGTVPLDAFQCHIRFGVRNFIECILSINSSAYH